MRKRSKSAKAKAAESGRKTSPGKSAELPGLEELFGVDGDDAELNETEIAERCSRIDALAEASGANCQAMADECASAREHLSIAEGKALAVRVRIGPADFYKFAEIGDDYRQNDPAIRAHIPLHKRSIRYLIASKFDDEDLNAAISANVLNTKAKRKELERFWHERHPPQTSDAADDPKADEEAPAEPKEAEQPAYAHILCRPQMARVDFDQGRKLLEQLSRVPGWFVRQNRSPSDLQHQRSMSAWKNKVDIEKRKLVRLIVNRELEHSLGLKPKNTPKEDWLRTEGYEPEQYQVPKDADDEVLIRVLETFKRASEFEEICRQAAERCGRPRDQVQLGLPVIADADAKPVLQTMRVASPPTAPEGGHPIERTAE